MHTYVTHLDQTDAYILVAYESTHRIWTSSHTSNTDQIKLSSQVINGCNIQNVKHHKICRSCSTG